MSLTFANLLRTCALTALLTLPVITAAEINLRAADQMVRQAKGWNAAGKYEEARAALVRYLERDSRSVLARLEYARTLSYLREFSAALAEYQHVLALEPQNLEARVGVAKVASWRGEFEKSLFLYNRILEETPALHDALVGKAHTLLWLGRKDEATALFLDAWPRNPSDREVGRMLEELGIDAEAVLQEVRRNEAREKEARMKAAHNAVPEPTLTVLPDQIPFPAADGSPSASSATPAPPANSGLRASTRVRKKPASAPPPKPAADRAAAQISLPAPLLMQAATLLILLAGGALAYRTHAVYVRKMRSQPLPRARRPYELPPSSLPVEVSAEAHVGAGVPVCPAEQSSANAASEKTVKTGQAHVGAGAPACPAEQGSANVAPEKTVKTGRAERVEKAEPAAQAEPEKTAKTEAEEAAHAAPLPARARPETLLWGRVLVVHPDEQVLEFTRRVLVGAGAEVLALRRGEDAMVRLEKTTYDALLLNDQLPGGWTGMEIYRWVKQHQPGAERSVMLVHSGLSHTQQFLEENGAVGVTAPFNVSDIIAITRLALDKAKAKAAPRA